MPTLRPHTKDYSEHDRERLGLAVTRAREAAGYPKRPAFARLANIGLTSLVKLETGKPVGPSIYEAVARVLPNWDLDTPRAVLEGGSIPEPRQEQPTAEPAQAPPDLLDKINYLRRKLGKEDFHLMWEVFTEINESNARFDEAEAAKARANEEVRPTENPARAAG